MDREALMRRTYAAAGVLLLCLALTFVRPSGGGEKVTYEGRKARIASVVGEVFSATETRETMRVLCDEIGGRVSGTPAGREARGFAERLLNGYGLSDVHQEQFEIQGWERGSFLCEAISPRRICMHAVALANTRSTPGGGVEVPVIDAGHGYPEELEGLGERLNGSFALVTAGSLPGKRWMHRSEVTALVAGGGAAGLLYQTTRPGNLPMTGMCWENGLSPIPAAGISFEDGERIRRMISAGDEVRVRLEMTNLTDPATSANVIGEIRGVTNELVIVGAHLDSWDLGQGAVDNGTGTVAVLEAARALSALGVRPEATIRFVLFMGEELGLAGARAYAEAHDGELSRCRAMINCDMTGTPLGVRLMGHEYANPFFEELLGSLEGFELYR
jgi:carboxypeptidase Q